MAYILNSFLNFLLVLFCLSYFVFLCYGCRVAIDFTFRVIRPCSKVK